MTNYYPMLSQGADSLSTKALRRLGRPSPCNRGVEIDATMIRKYEEREHGEVVRHDMVRQHDERDVKYFKRF